MNDRERDETDASVDATLDVYQTVRGQGPIPRPAVDRAATTPNSIDDGSVLGDGAERRSDTPTMGAVHGMPPVFSRGDIAGGRYRVIRFVAAGGMGQVFEVADRELHDERLALKTLNPFLADHSASAEQFKIEIQLARKVTHPNVCRIFDVGYHTFADGGVTAFLTMELLDGSTMRSHLRRGPMSSRDARVIAAQLARGLAAAHAVGIVHRDFKSENVILVGSQGATRAVITDFGVAVRTTDAAAASGMVGTPAYIAPELIDGGESTSAADLYSFGVVLYEMLSGTLPFIGSTPLATALARLQGPPPPLTTIVPNVDPSLAALVDACLTLEPSQRLALVTPMLRNLVREDGTVVPYWEPRGNRWRLLAASAAVAATIVSLLWLTIGQRLFARTPAVAATPTHRITKRTYVRLFVDESPDAASAKREWMGVGLSELARAEMSDAPRWRTVMPGDVAQFERGHEIAPAPYDKATAVVAATMLFADYIIEGGFTLGPVDGSITVHARLVDGTTGEEVFVAHASGGDLKSVATLLGKQMRDRLRFERSVPVSNGLWPASEVAAEDYGMALLAARSGKDTELLQLLSRTLAVEPTFEQASWMQKAMSTMLDRVLDGNRDPDLHSLPRDDAESAQIAMATARRTSTAAETASAARFAADPFDIELHLKALEVMASPTLETIDELRRLKATANLLQYPLFSYAEIGMWARRKSWISVMAMAAQATSDARGAHDALLLIGEESLVASAAEELTAWDTELSYASEAVDTARRIGNAVMVSRNHDSIVRALQKQGLFTRLETSIRASIADARRRGDEAAAKEDEITLASLMIETGRVEHAHRSLETVITPYFLSGEGVREGNYAQLEAARAALALGQLASAERDALASLSYYRAQNNDRLVAYARTLVANIAFARGGLDVARARATEALNARVAGHLMRVASQSRIQLAMIDIAAGQPAQAEHDLLAVLVDPAASCLMRDRAEASAYRALALLALDRDADALRSIDDARRFAADFESVPLALLVGRVRALVIAKRGDVQERRSARGSVAALRERADAGGYAVESLELRLVGAQIDLMDGKSANATRDAEGVAEAAETLGLGLIAKRARDVLAANAR